MPRLGSRYPTVPLTLSWSWFSACSPPTPTPTPTPTPYSTPNPNPNQLREIEVLCQQHEKELPPFLSEVMAILYKTDEADEFVAPAEVGEEVLA